MTLLNQINISLNNSSSILINNTYNCPAIVSFDTHSSMIMVLVLMLLCYIFIPYINKKLVSMQSNKIEINNLIIALCLFEFTSIMLSVKEWNYLNLALAIFDGCCIGWFLIDMFWGYFTLK